MIPVIIVGFIMITLGGALLLLGEVPFLGGKRIPAIRSRLIGLALVLFLPAAFGVRLGLASLFGEDVIDGLIVTWVLCGVSWTVVFVILFRVMFPKREPRPAKATASLEESKNPFGALEPNVKPTPIADPTPWTEPAPVKKPAAKKVAAKKEPRKAVEENPFDFS